MTMIRSFPVVPVLAAFALVSLSMPAAGSADGEAAKPKIAEPEVISSTATPNSGSVREMYKSPRRGEFLLTQACVEHGAMYVRNDESGARLTYGSAGCTHYDPGMRIAAGETLSCVNRSGQSRTCSLVGIVSGAPERPKRLVITP